MERCAPWRGPARRARQAEGGKIRYVPLPPELAAEFRRFPAILGEDRNLPPKPGAKGDRQRVEKSFDNLLTIAGIEDFRFHDLRHTFGTWYMMNGGDLYELAKILGHSNLKMTERYAKLAKNTSPERGARHERCGRCSGKGRGTTGRISLTFPYCSQAC